MSDVIPVDPREFRTALGRFPTGVAVITAPDPDGGFVGMTVNSFTSVSLDPPLVLWCIDRDAWSLPAFLKAGYYAVNVLAVDQRGIADRFARRGEEKFAGLEVEEGIGGTALLGTYVARFQCRTVQVHEAGDHLVLVGEVLAFDRCDRPPLVFFAGRYGEVTQPEA